IEEMGSKEFTGICTIIIDGESAVMVLEMGQVVLAEYGDIQGQQALDAVLKEKDTEAEAELNLLTPEQLQLALEFNRSAAIRNPGTAKKQEAPPGRTASGGGERVHIPTPGAKSLQEMSAAPRSTDNEVDTLTQNMEDINIEQLVSKFRVSCRD